MLVLDASGHLSLANDRARSLFNISKNDIGRPIQDLEVSYRPVELRSSFEQAYTLRRPVVHNDIPYIAPSGEALALEVTVSPVPNEYGEPVGISVVAEDVTTRKRLQEELMNFNQELETAYEEVQSTNEELQTTNEELQSTVEELETTNEELQSTNEELETMNEELQSTNEELETINAELSKRGEEVLRANGFLQSILGSLQDGVIVVDENLNVLAWNHRSEDLWGLRAEEVLGKHVMNLDIGLPLAQLLHEIRHALQGAAAHGVPIEATNRRGQNIQCRASCAPLFAGEGSPRGAIILVQRAASVNSSSSEFESANA
jgi:two-component system, chemotaxis family, CheB/CheR fusion protein